MTLIDVGIIIFIVSCFGTWNGIKRECIEPIQWMRREVKIICKERERKNITWSQSINNIEINDCSCKPPRWGVPRQWWERKTYQEQLEEFNGRKKQ